MTSPVIFAAEEGGGSFLVTPGIGLMIWTLLVFGVSMYVLAKVAFPRIAEALDKRQKAIEESIETAERTQARGRRAARRSTASGSPRPAARPTRSSPAPARPARRTRTRSLAEAKAQARGDDGADAPRHRGRDAPRDPGDPQRGRRPHRRRDREGHAQDAHRATTSGGSSRRRSPSSTSPRSRRARSGARPWRRSPRSTPARCSRSPQEQDKLDKVREQLGEFADALNDDARAAGVLLLAVLLHQGEERGPRQGDLRRRRDDR